MIFSLLWMIFFSLRHSYVISYTAYLKMLLVRRVTGRMLGTLSEQLKEGELPDVTCEALDRNETYILPIVQSGNITRSPCVVLEGWGEVSISSRTSTF